MEPALYTFTRYFSPLFFSILFRKIRIDGLDKVPIDAPVIFASNHPNSFLDAVVIGTFSNRSIHTLARGDVFKTSVARFWLKQINLHPVHRLSEGKEHLHKNDETTKTCIQLLKKNKAIVIFAEGISIIEKRFRPVKKGTARIAMLAQEEIAQDMYVVPVALNYTFPLGFRGDLLIRYGQPIKLSQYMESYDIQGPKVVNEITREISRHFQENVVHINEDADVSLAETALELFRNELGNKIFPIIQNNNEQLRGEWRIAAEINILRSSNTNRLEELTDTANKLSNLLTSHGLPSCVLSEKSSTPLLPLPLHYLLFLPGHLGLAAYYLPYKLADHLGIRLIHSNVFYASVFYGAWFISSFLLSLLFFVTFYLLTDSFLFGSMGVIILAAMAFTGLIIKENQKIISANRKARKLKRASPEIWEMLLKMKKEILSGLT